MNFPFSLQNRFLQITYLLLLSFVFILTGCSKDLSRNKAKDILNEHPIPVGRAFIGNGISGGLGNQNIDKLLIDAGYVVGGGDIGWGGHFTHFTPTEKLKPFIVGKGFMGHNDCVQLGTATVKDITGITKVSENECYVEFTTTVKINEVGQLFGISDIELQQNLQPKTAAFRLYDNGWKFLGIIR